MIFSVWFFAVIVSLAPQFGWKDPEYMERIEQQKCMVSQDVIYQVPTNSLYKKTLSKRKYIINSIYFFSFSSLIPLVMSLNLSILFCTDFCYLLLILCSIINDFGAVLENL